MIPGDRDGEFRWSQIKHLIQWLFVGDQLVLDQFQSGLGQGAAVHIQPLTDGLVRVIAQTLSI
ncbi:MAG: hypothetical protein JRI56_10640 [Deltaproteobacteria bacterium]|nr:hypothetical protein [Deltaproteobacteria bacterium]